MFIIIFKDISKWGVYEARRKDTNEVVYIGCSWSKTYDWNNKTGVEKRINGHKRELKKNKHRNPHLQNIYNKVGLTFRHVVFCLPIKELCLMKEVEYGNWFDFNKLCNVNPLGFSYPDSKGKNNYNYRFDLTDKIREQICIDYENGMNGPELDDKYNLGSGTSYDILKENGIKRRSVSESIKLSECTKGKKNPRYNHNLTNKIREQICIDYKNGMSSFKIGDKYNTAHSTIIKILKDNNIKRRSYSECQIGLRKGKDNHNFKNDFVTDIIKAKNIFRIANIPFSKKDIANLLNMTKSQYIHINRDLAVRGLTWEGL